MNNFNDYGAYMPPQDPELIERQKREQEQALAEEKVYREAMNTISNLGYNTIQEALVDLMVEGYYNKDEGEWVEITDPSDIQTNRNHMNLAQAKFYGLNIIRLGEFIDNSNVKFA